MILIEPEELYVSRTRQGCTITSTNSSSASISRELHGPLRYTDCWDEHIIVYTASRPEPIRIVSLASQLRKCIRHRDKQHKEAIKRQILLRVGALIRTGSLVRVRRKYVTLPRPVMRSSPL
jgi:hypothetical protein